MPELRFKEEEPQRTNPVAEPVVEEVKLVAGEPHIRFGEWQTAETDAYVIPKPRHARRGAALWVMMTGYFLLIELTHADTKGMSTIPLWLWPIFLILGVEVVLVCAWTLRDRRDWARFGRRMPAEYEVLLPRTVQRDARREVLEELTTPFFAAQAVAVIAASLIAHYLFVATHPQAGGTDLVHWVFMAILAPLFASVCVLLPVVRTIRRYRFLRSRGG